jgi:hypothetical protein
MNVIRTTVAIARFSPSMSPFAMCCAKRRTEAIGMPAVIRVSQLSQALMTPQEPASSVPNRLAKSGARRKLTTTAKPTRTQLVPVLFQQLCTRSRFIGIRQGHASLSG